MDEAEARRLSRRYRYAVAVGEALGEWRIHPMRRIDRSVGVFIDTPSGYDMEGDAYLYVDGRFAGRVMA